MQVQSTSSATTAQTKQAPSKKVKKEFIPAELKNDIVSIKDIKTSQKVAIGILTLSSAIAGFQSAKSGLFRTINTIIMAAVGFAASISLTKADDNKKESAPAESKQEVKQGTQPETKPDVKPDDKPELKAEKNIDAKTEKDDDKDDD